jgi:hypothetical protein
MDKLIIIFLFFLILYYANKVYKNKYGLLTNENFMNKKLQPFVIDFYNIVNNPIDFTNYKSLVLYKENKNKNLLTLALDQLKKKSVFISLNKSNKKPMIGIFLASSQQLSKILDKMNITQQDFLNQGHSISNGLVLFYLMVNPKYLKNKNKNTFEKLFEKLIHQATEKANKDKYDYFIFPMQKNYYMDSRTKVLKENDFVPIYSYTLNGHYYRKFIPKNILISES